MWKWLAGRRAPRQKSDPEFRGVPPKFRQKSYSAATGYVYQYVYRGYKDLPAERPGRVFVFSATRDRAHYFEVQIELLDSQVSGAASSALSNAERYAVAKMTLFAAFDEYAEAAMFEEPVTPDSGAVRDHLATLGRL